jgi:hypothetical protein
MEAIENVGGRDRGRTGEHIFANDVKKLIRRSAAHLRLLHITSNGQLGQPRSRVIVKHQTPECRRPAGREARTQASDLGSIPTRAPRKSPMFMRVFERLKSKCAVDVP